MSFADEIPIDDPFEAVEIEPVIGTGPVGWVYFIACTETMRCKIGFTTGQPEKRLKNLQTGSAAKLRFIAKQPGTAETERRLHERFASYCVHGEWFQMHGELFAYICAVVWCMARVGLQLGFAPEDWLLSGLRMLDDGICELPDDLAALIAEDAG